MRLDQKGPVPAGEPRDDEDPRARTPPRQTPGEDFRALGMAALLDRDGADVVSLQHRPYAAAIERGRVEHAERAAEGGLGRDLAAEVGAARGEGTQIELRSESAEQAGAHHRRVGVDDRAHIHRLPRFQRFRRALGSFERGSPPSAVDDGRARRCLLRWIARCRDPQPETEFGQFPPRREPLEAVSRPRQPRAGEDRGIEARGEFQVGALETRRRAQALLEGRRPPRRVALSPPARAAVGVEQREVRAHHRLARIGDDDTTQCGETREVARRATGVEWVAIAGDDRDAARRERPGVDPQARGEVGDEGAGELFPKERRARQGNLLAAGDLDQRGGAEARRGPRVSPRGTKSHLVEVRRRAGGRGGQEDAQAGRRGEPVALPSDRLERRRDWLRERECAFVLRG